jgi:ParB/RepB/Spo0J family partition protein
MVEDIPLDKIKLPLHYVREGIDEDHIEFLFEDIKKRGLLEPLLVKPLPQGLYEIVNGVHRYSALRKLGWASAPCIIKEASSQEAVILQIITNYRSRRLRDHELIRAIALMHDELEMKLSDVAKELGYSKGHVSKLYKIYKDLNTYEELKSGVINLEEAYQRVKGRYGKSFITKLSYRVRCIVCSKEGSSDDYYKSSTCLDHASHLQKWVKAAREVYGFKGNEGLREFSKKLDKLAGELMGRKNESLVTKHNPKHNTSLLSKHSSKKVSSRNFTQEEEQI